jgi:hypothetical protein
MTHSVRLDEFLGGLPAYLPISSVITIFSQDLMMDYIFL